MAVIILEVLYSFSSPSRIYTGASPQIEVVQEYQQILRLHMLNESVIRHFTNNCTIKFMFIK